MMARGADRNDPLRFLATLVIDIAVVQNFNDCGSPLHSDVALRDRYGLDAIVAWQALHRH